MSKTLIKMRKNKEKRDKCIYLHKLCKYDCDNYVCRAYFPESQPYVLKRDEPMCMSATHKECLRFIEANQWRAQRRMDSLKIHCPFASNTRCGRPWEWWCKGGDYPFKLTTYEIKDGTDDIPLRDENGDIKFTHDQEILNQTCFSGKTEVYEACPNYILGMRHREEWRRERGK